MILGGGPDDFGIFPICKIEEFDTCRRFLACVLLGFCVQGTLIDLPISQPPVAQTVLARPTGRVCAVWCNGAEQIAKQYAQNWFWIGLGRFPGIAGTSFVQRCSVDRSCVWFGAGDVVR